MQTWHNIKIASPNTSISNPCHRISPSYQLRMTNIFSINFELYEFSICKFDKDTLSIFIAKHFLSSALTNEKMKSKTDLKQRTNFQSPRHLTLHNRARKKMQPQKFLSPLLASFAPLCASFFWSQSSLLVSKQLHQYAQCVSIRAAGSVTCLAHFTTNVHIRTICLHTLFSA